MLNLGVLSLTIPLFYWLWGVRCLRARALIPQLAIHLGPDDRHMLGHRGKKDLISLDLSFNELPNRLN